MYKLYRLSSAASIVCIKLKRVKQLFWHGQSPQTSLSAFVIVGNRQKLRKDFPRTNTRWDIAHGGQRTIALILTFSTRLSIMYK